MNDEPPLTHIRTKFIRLTWKSRRRLRLGKDKDMEVPLACGIGLCGIRPLLFSPLLDAHGENQCRT